MTKTDLRVVKSKKVIKEAFIDLMEEAGYDKITITDIAERAMINRKTFYLHYESKAALFDEILNEALLVLLKNLKYESLDFDSGLYAVDLSREIEIIVHNASSERRLFQVLMNDPNNSELTARLTEKVQNGMLNKLLEVNSASASLGIPAELLTQSLLSMMIGILKWWLNQDDYSEKDAASIFFKLISTSILESMGFQGGKQMET